MSIYTKTGDKGKTGLFDGSRISKDSKLIEAIGTIDELNSFLGLVGDQVQVQKDLFTINAILAGHGQKLSKLRLKELERDIDRIESILPPQTYFLVYGGCRKAALLYVSRAICRRAERQVVGLSKKKEIDDIVLVYLNRLSDFLFVQARIANHIKNIQEEEWK